MPFRIMLGENVSLANIRMPLAQKGRTNFLSACYGEIILFDKFQFIERLDKKGDSLLSLLFSFCDNKEKLPQNEGVSCAILSQLMRCSRKSI